MKTQQQNCRGSQKFLSILISDGWVTSVNRDTKNKRKHKLKPLVRK